MSETLTVAPRTEFGKRNSKRLRNSGHLPAIVYGKGEESLSVSIPLDQINAAIRHRAKLVELEGHASGRALIQEMQWDTFSTHVLHVDLLRVDADERVTLHVLVELRGTAPGESEGGVVEHLLHEIEIETAVDSIPDKLHVNINSLELNGSLGPGDIEDLPEGATFVTSESATIVQCVLPAVEPEDDEVSLSEVEPEVIGRKDSEDGEES